MPSELKSSLSRRGIVVLLSLVVLVAVAGLVFLGLRPGTAVPADTPTAYQPRRSLDTSGFRDVLAHLPPWPESADLGEIARAWDQAGPRLLLAVDQYLTTPRLTDRLRIDPLLKKAMLLCFQGQPLTAYRALEEAREKVERQADLAEEWLYTIIYYQGVASLRQGEDDNCVLCRGESSCIFPLASAAVHTNPTGSRRAVRHFTEYLDRFPDDVGVRWLLNLAHMTLGEHPHEVPSRFLLPLDRLEPSGDGIGAFRDVSHLVGLTRLNHAGGAVLEDFDNDGLLDLTVTSMSPSEPMAFYRNRGDGSFEDRTEAAGLSGQLGGLYCVQADYDNDGHVDLFIPRGAWLPHPIPPSLLRNNGDGTFTDVTRKAGLAEPCNSITAAWADFDNDGLLDLFVCCERQPNRLYRNRGNGTFEEIAGRAGVQGKGWVSKGCAWIDFDHDRYPDLFVNNISGIAQLYRNNRDGTFTDVTRALGIAGPERGFSCWAWDFDNDGWLDILASSYFFTLGEVVSGLQGERRSHLAGRLYRNRGGKGFDDLTATVGLDRVYAPMGSNLADLDNDGWLDFYLGTGAPDLGTLVPNRLFRNLAGQRFADITASSRTGHLQKGHGVACGDWDRDGDVDLFVQTGGAVPGDRYHNVLFQNPGQGNAWLNVKLVGRRSNRSALGARIKVVTAGESPLTIHRHVSTGSSFGGNPLEQLIGLGRATRVALLEVHWPTSGTTQSFRDLAVDQAIEVTEFARDYRRIDRKPIPLPR